MAVRLNVERKGVELEWDETGDEPVTVYAQGEEGDWHNTAEIPNDGFALVSYPAAFTGSSDVEIRTADGTVVDSGSVEIT